MRRSIRYDTSFFMVWAKARKECSFLIIRWLKPTANVIYKRLVYQNLPSALADGLKLI